MRFLSAILAVLCLSCLTFAQVNYGELSWRHAQGCARCDNCQPEQGDITLHPEDMPAVLEDFDVTFGSPSIPGTCEVNETNDGCDGEDDCIFYIDFEFDWDDNTHGVNIGYSWNSEPVTMILPWASAYDGDHAGVDRALPLQCKGDADVSSTFKMWFREYYEINGWLTYSDYLAAEVEVTCWSCYFYPDEPFLAELKEHLREEEQSILLSPFGMLP